MPSPFPVQHYCEKQTSEVWPSEMKTLSFQVENQFEHETNLNFPRFRFLAENSELPKTRSSIVECATTHFPSGAPGIGYHVKRAGSACAFSQWMFRRPLC